MTRRNWKTYQPSSLRDALVACKDFALAKRNLSVERIAERMGLADHWSVYKWLANGRMPANLIHPYEHACGIDFVTRWFAAAGDKLLVAMPRGKAPQQIDLVAINSSCAHVVQLLTAFYAANGKVDQAETLDAIRSHLEEVAYHQHNVAVYATPELEF